MSENREGWKLILEQLKQRSDFAQGMGGSIGHPNAAKRARLVRLAKEQLYPLVLLLDGAGERASNQNERYPNSPGDLQLVADLKGIVPVVTVVLGISAGHGALTGMFADLIIMLAGSTMFTAGPPLVKASPSPRSIWEGFPPLGAPKRPKPAWMKLNR